MNPNLDCAIINSSFKRQIFKFTSEIHFPAIKRVHVWVKPYRQKQMGIYLFISNEIREGVLTYVLLKDINKTIQSGSARIYIHPFNEIDFNS